LTPQGVTAVDAAQDLAEELVTVRIELLRSVARSARDMLNKEGDARRSTPRRVGGSKPMFLSI
jgi:hypothetical protein